MPHMGAIHLLQMFLENPKDSMKHSALRLLALAAREQRGEETPLLGMIKKTTTTLTRDLDTTTPRIIVLSTIASLLVHIAEGILKPVVDLDHALDQALKRCHRSNMFLKTLSEPERMFLNLN
jgi:hypothetical protein